MIISFILFAIFEYLLGYAAGYMNGSKKDIKEFIDETGKTIRIESKKLGVPTIPTGRIKPITAQQALNRNQNPERKEAQEEMKKTLDQIPDLVKAKELFASLKQEEYKRG